jgi:hypothetical protein
MNFRWFFLAGPELSPYETVLRVFQGRAGFRAA